MTGDQLSTLQILLGANAHEPIIKAIVETLGDGAVEALSNAVRQLDLRVTGELREIETIAAEHIGELKAKDKEKVRKQLERIVRGLVRRSANQVMATRGVQERGGPWRSALGAVALDIIRAHGAVDVLDQWKAQAQGRTYLARQEAIQTITNKTKKRNAVILAEAAKASSTTKRKQAESAAVKAQLQGFDVSPAAVRSVIQREETRKK